MLVFKRKQQVLREQNTIPTVETAAIEPVYSTERATASEGSSLDVELSPREREFFDQLLTKFSTKEITKNLDLTYSRANFHIQKLYSKLGVQSRTEFLSKFIKK